MKSIALDTESYQNYFLIRFSDGSAFELRDENETLSGIDKVKIKTLMKGKTFGFNSNSYDLRMITAAVQNNYSCIELNALSNWIITENSKYWQTDKEFCLDVPSNWNHIDLIEPSPGVFISLKKYGARMGTKKLQDLPYPPGDILTGSQMDEVKTYCLNDLVVTAQLYDAVSDRLDLREKLSSQYSTDMMSKSDAQCAEAIFRAELGHVKRAGDLPANYTISYMPPQWLRFEADDLNGLLIRLRNEQFVLRSGKIALPTWLKLVTVGDTTYKFGIGGLHSTEKKQVVVPGKSQRLIDADVASYYPSIIRQMGLYPKHLGDEFLNVYGRLIDRRLAAKHSGDAVVAGSLKIALNGSFGKFGNKYSFLFSPDLLLAVTLTGQLALLMLIEQYEKAGIKVMSANTDGVVCLMSSAQYDTYADINEGWEFTSGFSLEETDYAGLYSRDVNNYLAVKPDGSSKGKGVFTDTGLMKDPAAAIVHKAVTQYLVNDVEIEGTIRMCSDINEFVVARNCTGGAQWREQYLGKTVRWIYSVGGDPILSCKNGNKVATSDGAYPVMDLPEAIPRFLDYDKYIAMANKLLTDCGYER